MSKILAIKARQILDSRGNPTVECDIKTNDGIFRASAPSGASTGRHEAHELRDNTPDYHGKSVQRAVKNVNIIIAKRLKGKNPSKQEELDKLMLKIDGTPDKHRLGANAILAVSMAITRAGAGKQPLYEHIRQLYGNKKLTMPVPAFNIINGGKHAGNKLDIQEYMLLPAGAKNFSEALQIGTETYHELKKHLQHTFGSHATNVGDEGGFAPPLTCIEEPFDYITNATIKLGHWKQTKLGIDSAATTFWKGRNYYLEGKEYSTAALMETYENIANSYPLASIEDPFQEDDFSAFAELNKRLKNTQIVGDDLLCTNPKRIKKAIASNSCNCLLLKINQIGTITEAFEAAKLAQNAGWNIMASHRSGETEDSFVADLAVGIGASQIKAGAPCRGERLAKYNQLLRIEEQLGRKAKYAGKTIKFDLNKTS